MSAPTLGPVEHDRPTDRRQVLALSGGGYRGLYTAAVLEGLEDKAKRPLRDMFDVIAGTSIGAIVAAGLALGVPARVVREGIIAHGPAIFDRRMRIGKWRLPLRNVLRPLYFAKHPAAPLRNAITSILGAASAQPMCDLQTPLLITAVDASTGQHHLFRSGGLGGQPDASSVALVDALMASAAAPTYFPAHTVNRQRLVDGGLIANAPDMVAMTETLRLLGVALRDLRLLSVGSAGSAHQIRGGGARFGVVEWLARGLVQLTLSAQESLAISQCEVLLDENYLRIDASPDAAQSAHLGLDRATDAATRTLLLLAANSVDAAWSQQRAKLRRYLSHAAIGPKEQVVPLLPAEPKT